MTAVVTGANGLVGARVCAALVERGATVRAVVRRRGTAPALDGVEEWVGEFSDPDLAGRVIAGADAVVTTVHPMGSDRATQQRIAVEGTPVLARAARDAGVSRLVHVSTAGVYDRSPEVGDVDEARRWWPTTPAPTRVTKRDTDAALAEVDGLTRVLVRPPAILGSGETSIWNTLRPAEMRDDERAATPYPTRPSPGCTSTTSRHSPPTRLGPGRDGARPRPDRSRARAPPSTSPPARRRSATTTARSPARSESTRCGTTGPPGPARSWPTARTDGAGPDRRPAAGAGRDRRRPAGLTASLSAVVGPLARRGLDRSVVPLDRFVCLRMLRRVLRHTT